VPQAAPSSTYSPASPLVPTERIRRGQWEKCRSATADSYSLDASAALSRRPSDPCVDPGNDADEAPGVPAGRRRRGHATALEQDSSPSSFVHQSTTHPHVSTVVGQGRVSTLNWLRHHCVTTTSSCCRSPPRLGLAKGVIGSSVSLDRDRGCSKTLQGSRNRTT
jgi:hypothetical protein